MTALPFPHLGGISSYLFDELKYFCKKGHRIILVYPSSNMTLEKDFGHKEVRLIHLRSLDTDIEKITEKVLRVLLLKRLMSEEKVSMLHTHDFLSAFISILAGYSKKTILHTHGVLSKDKLQKTWAECPSGKTTFRMLMTYLIEFFLETLTFNLVRRIICINADVQQDAMRRTLSGKKILVLLNGVDVLRFKPRPEKRKEQRYKLRIPEHVIVCLYLGRMVPTHGPLLLSKAIPTVNEKTGGVIFLFVGEGVQKERIVEDVRDQRLSNVFFPSVTRPEDIYSASDIFLDNLSNIVKGHGISILEAMASGVPVITGRDEIKEKAFVEGEEILFAEKDDPKDIAEKIVSLVFDSKKREELSLRGRKRVVADFSVEKHMQILEKILLSE